MVEQLEESPVIWSILVVFVLSLLGCVLDIQNQQTRPQDTQLPPPDTITDGGDGRSDDSGMSGDGYTPPSQLSLTTVHAGEGYTCARTVTNSVECWASDGSAAGGALTPPADKFAQISVSGRTACGRRSDGTLSCWGKRSGIAANAPSGEFLQVTVGASRACAISSGGELQCWDENSSPSALAPNRRVQDVAIRDTTPCIVTSKGEFECIGGDGGSTGDIPDGNYLGVSAGEGQVCARSRSGGTVFCKGGPKFKDVTPPSGQFVQIDSGRAHTCGIDNAGRVLCWGVEKSGELDVPNDQFQYITAGSYYSCGLKQTGELVCWGDAAVP